MEFLRGSVQPAPSEDRISEVEASFEVSFPKAYVDLLLVGNGGIPTRCHVPDGRNTRVIDRFLCILDDYEAAGEIAWYEVEAVFTQIQDRLVAGGAMLGTDLVPIVALVGGDLVCLDYRECPGGPTVCILDHEQSDEGEPCTREIAMSFESFLQLLTLPTGS